MQTPMFSRDSPDLMHADAMIAMDFLPFCRAMQDILTRNPQDLLRYHDALLSVLDSFRFINDGPDAKKKLQDYRGGLQTCFQLFQLVADFKAQDLLAVITACIPKLNEGQEKWTLNDKTKIDVDRYPEAALKKQLTGYQTLYEALVRYSIIPFVWCIDTVESLELSSKKAEVGDVESYFRHNVSYQMKRIQQPKKAFPFQVDLQLLVGGLDDNWRNAIAHETLEYRDGGVLLIDADPRNLSKPAWEHFATPDEIGKKIDRLYVTHYVHTTALILFGFEHEDKIDWSGHTGWKTEKELAILIAQRVERLKLAICPPIEFHAERIVLNLKKQVGFDHPSSAFWGGPGGTGWVDIPAFSVEKQLFLLAKFCSSVKAPQEHLEVHLLNDEGVQEEVFSVDMAIAEKLPMDAQDISSAVQKSKKP